MVRRTMPLGIRKFKKKRQRSKVRDAARILQQVEDRSSECNPLRGFPIQRAAHIFEHGDGRKADFAGLIFMCNTSTKQDCFRYRVFGLPEAQRNLVERIRRGMTLFLFDVDLNSLHGIYKASSPGGINLQADAFRASTKIFPWQVRFTIYKDCAPLAENVFKAAIKDNYDGNRNFKIELTGEQVQKLVKLFQSPRRDVAAGAPPRTAPLVPIFGPLSQSEAPPRIIYEPKFPVPDKHLQEQVENNMHADPPPRAVREPYFEAQHVHSGVELRLPQKTPHHNLLSAKLSLPEYVPVREIFSSHGADSILGGIELYKTDPYPMGPVEVKLRSGYSQERSLNNRVVQVVDRYMQRLQPGPGVQKGLFDERAYTRYPFVSGLPVYKSISSEGLRERSFDDTYFVDRARRFLSERPRVKELLPGSIAHQSEVPY